MNMRKLLLRSIAVMVSAFALTSCDSDDTYYYYVPYQANAIVTVKTAENGDWYMQLDDSTTLYATNIHQAPYNKEVRALVSCYETGGDANGYSKAVFVNRQAHIFNNRTFFYLRHLIFKLRIRQQGIGVVFLRPQAAHHHHAHQHSECCFNPVVAALSGKIQRLGLL